jgi:hypothetical protein
MYLAQLDQSRFLSESEIQWQKGIGKTREKSWESSEIFFQFLFYLAELASYSIITRLFPRAVLDDR